MKRLTKITATVTLIFVFLSNMSIFFVRKTLSRIYHEVAGPDPALPTITLFYARVTEPVSLVIISLFCILILGFTEYFIKTEGKRLLIQGAVIVLYVLFLALGMLSFVVPFYIPEVEILG